ncbi:MULTISPECIES: divergent polysaccharide deacetylase family protein [unclassified Aureimonas]|uniref:divergent polysaccharide deacetylase family protein n=1 Tax=unclassified Aureimonas TaxID=2615206 RepID=UPI0006FB19F6|nr:MULTISPECIES: divergent polysaccharide deacetylase family protein [unclassified Aureimonas]KQT66003.1 hypothetical protein ASG62_21050 [Aureimonas sp. Leaf427]KQT73361.1 hypothetical protein ASG54_17530 [Aureimonas sp. Leaf460]
MLDDLRRPLGRDLTRAPARRKGPTSRQILGAGVFVALLAGSAATVLLQPEFRQGDLIADLAAQKAAAAAKAEIAAAPLQPLPPATRVERAALADPSLPTVTYPPGTAGLSGAVVDVSDPGSIRQAPSFADRPDDALIEVSDDGPLPIRAADGRRPFDVYSMAPASEAGARIAIVVGGLGISQTGTQAAIEALPSGVTLGFAPMGNSLDRWMKEARRSGHELLLQVPMEPFGYPATSPGDDTVTTAEISAGYFGALSRSLGRLTNYVGVANFMGARLTADPAAMTAFMSELSRRGLMFLDDGSSVRSVSDNAARSAGTVHARADVLLDGEQDAGSITAKLDTLERAARANGTAIGTASAFDVSVATISTWVKAAEQRGITVVPISALAFDPEAR